MKRPNIASGRRGTKYYIEFPMTGKGVEPFKVLVQVQQLLNSRKKDDGARIINTDSFTKDDMVSYLLDYDVNSTTAVGAKNKGHIYIRGVTGGDTSSFKFILEKNVDFH